MNQKKQIKDNDNTLKEEKPLSIKEGLLFPAEDIVKDAEGESTPAPKRKGRKRSMVTEERPPLTFDHMRELLEGITEITTPTGIRYIHLRLTKRMIIGTRETSGKEFTINLDELYETYQHCLRFTSPEVKRHIFMGHSPAVILLRMLKEKAQEEL